MHSIREEPLPQAVYASRPSDHGSQRWLRRQGWKWSSAFRKTKAVWKKSALEYFPWLVVTAWVGTWISSVPAALRACAKGVPQLWSQPSVALSANDDDGLLFYTPVGAPRRTSRACSLCALCFSSHVLYKRRCPWSPPHKMEN